MALRYYSNAPATTLAAGCTNVATSIQVASVTGLPVSYPYTLILDRGTATEEVVDVTNAVGTTLTVSRGADSTTAFAHSLGATVSHGISARDVREANQHANATGAVHGLAGSVVGTSDTQTLTNKDLSSGTNTFPASLATLTGSQTLTNKTIALGSNSVSGTTAQFNSALSDGDFATLAGLETLSNKNLSSPIWTGIGEPVSAVKVSNETVSGTSYQNDDELLVSVAANSTYDLTLVLFASSLSGTVDMKVALSVPTGATYSGGSDGGVALSYNSPTDTLLGQFSSMTSVVKMYILRAQVKTGGTAGVVTVRWAQATASGTTVLYANSAISGRRIA